MTRVAALVRDEVRGPALDIATLFLLLNLVLIATLPWRLLG
jgi:hypothetical protein